MRGKKKTSKTKILLIIGLIVIMGSVLIQGISGDYATVGTTGGNNNDPSSDWKSAFNSNEKQLIYLGRPSCSWCNKIRPGLNKLVEKYNIKNIYINMDEISQSDQNTIFQKLEIDINNFGTPYLVVMENGEKKYEQIGYLPEEELFTFFKSSGLIGINEKY